jgi:hypothetical protein
VAEAWGRRPTSVARAPASRVRVPVSRARGPARERVHASGPVRGRGPAPERHKQLGDGRLGGAGRLGGVLGPGGGGE